MLTAMDQHYCVLRCLWGNAECRLVNIFVAELSHRRNTLMAELHVPDGSPDHRLLPGTAAVANDARIGCNRSRTLFSWHRSARI